METYAREFGLFIDGLRIDRQVSREDLCDGIMSLSQYKRYLRGDTSIPNSKLVQIADRLKFSISEIHMMYQAKQDVQFTKISELFKLMRSHKPQEAFNKAVKMKDEVILSESNQLFFDFCFVYIQHNLKMASDINALDLYSNMINYPDCVNNESFNFVEINILLQIVTISARMDIFEPADIMYKILTSKTFNIGFAKDTSFVPATYSTLAQTLGEQRKFDQAIDVTRLGIQFCIKHNTTIALALLFLLNSFAHHDLGNIDEAHESGKKAMMQVYIENKPDKFESYKNWLESKLEIGIDELMKFDK